MGLKSWLRGLLRKTTGYDLVLPAKDKPVYYRDGIYTWHNHAFMRDPRFMVAYNRGIEGTGDDRVRSHGEWRTHIAFWAAQSAINLRGDFIECGVFHAFMSSAIMTYLDWNNAANGVRFFLVDNFEGIVEELLTIEERALGRTEQYGDDYSNTFEIAKRNVSEFRNAILVRGTVPEILSSIETDRVAFLHLDMNSSAPEVAALRYFWNKLVPGAIVILDDYAFSGYEPQQGAIDDLAAEIGFTVASLPTGQGLIVKSH